MIPVAAGLVTEGAFVAFQARAGTGVQVVLV